MKKKSWSGEMSNKRRFGYNPLSKIINRRKERKTERKKRRKKKGREQKWLRK